MLIGEYNHLFGINGSYIGNLRKYPANIAKKRLYYNVNNIFATHMQHILKNEENKSVDNNDIDKIESQNTFIEKIKSFPPSVKFVLKILELKGTLTQKEIIDETYLPDRTVRYALNKLKIEGIVEERLHRKDARQVLYMIKEPIEEDISNFACGFV